MALTPDYDDDPERWAAWRPKQDVPDVVAGELVGPVLDIGCGEGRLADALADGVTWIGVDQSITQLRNASGRPVVQADMRALPFKDGAFAEATHLWCLYHVDDPTTAVAEAHRVLRPAGRYYACTSARTNDPELVPEGYPPTSFDAEEARGIVGTVFADVVEEQWDEPLYALETPAEVEAYCRQHLLPIERAATVALPLRLTKRGVLLRARLGS